MTPLAWLVMAAAVFVVLRKLRRDYLDGLCWAIALMVALPDELAVPLGFAEFTVQRIIVLTLAFFWMRERRAGNLPTKVPFLGIFVLILVTQLGSLALSTAFSDSLKGYLSLVFETVLLFSIISTSLTTEDAITRALQTVVKAVAFVALLALVERYTGINWPRLLLFGEGQNEEGDVSSIYRHRIMMGYVMAMTCPLCTLFASSAQSKRERFRWSISLLILVGACYFSFSRGPWLGFVLVTAMFSILSRGPIRKVMLIIVGVAAVVVVLRPGVRETMIDLLDTLVSTDQNSVKVTSREYRTRLWYVAWTEINKAPERFLLGYGGNSYMYKDYSEYFDHEAGGTTIRLGYTSWDNQYAVNLQQYGVLGCTAGIALHVALVLGVLKSWWRSRDSRKELALATLATVAVFLWGNTNVAIFNPQLTWLFLISGASGVKIGDTLRRQDPDWEAYPSTLAEAR